MKFSYVLSALVLILLVSAPFSSAVVYQCPGGKVSCADILVGDANQRVVCYSLVAGQSPTIRYHCGTRGQLFTTTVPPTGVNPKFVADNLNCGAGNFECIASQ